ncbi:MAG: glycoside hydrolase family 97 C-terminal domain-containing protein [Alistipes shahii]
MARQAKQSGQWFAAGVTDENARTLDVSLDFLEKGRKYEATIYADAPDATTAPTRRHTPSPVARSTAAPG